MQLLIFFILSCLICIFMHCNYLFFYFELSQLCIFIVYVIQLLIFYAGMIKISHSQSGKYVGWLQNGEKAIFKSLIEGLKSQNINRNQSVYAYLISKIEF